MNEPLQEGTKFQRAGPKRLLLPFTAWAAEVIEFFWRVGCRAWIVAQVQGDDT